MDNEEVLNKLSRAWNDVLEIFEPDDSWLTDLPKCKLIQQKLSYFDSDHGDTPEYIDRVFKGISRGKSLVVAAIEWQHPAIGKKSKGKIDKHRGIQWRLVIAYTGFEIISKSLIVLKDKKDKEDLNKNHEKFIQKCLLPNYEPIEPPKNKPNLQEWLEKGDKELALFLGLRGKDIGTINRWLAESKPVDSWEGAFKLAKALRNATAHGFLSPTKISEWGLKPGFSRLTNDLAIIVAAGLSKITEELGENDLH